MLVNRNTKPNPRIACRCNITNVKHFINCSYNTDSSCAANLFHILGTSQQSNGLQGTSVFNNPSIEQKQHTQFECKKTLYGVPKLARSETITAWPGLDDGSPIGSTKFLRTLKTDNKGRKSVAISNVVQIARVQSRDTSLQPTYQRKQTIMFASLNQLNRGSSMQRSVAKNDFNGKSRSLGSGLDKNARPGVVSSKSALGIEKGSTPIFLLSEWL